MISFCISVPRKVTSEALAKSSDKNEEFYGGYRCHFTLNRVGTLHFQSSYLGKWKQGVSTLSQLLRNLLKHLDTV